MVDITHNHVRPRFDFRFTVQCPHCTRLFEVNHFAIEVLADKTILGFCPKCNSQIMVHLIARPTDDEWECGCVLPEQNCPACRAAARKSYGSGDDELPY